MALINSKWTNKNAQQMLLFIWGWTLKKSSAMRIQALVSTDVFLPGFCRLTSAFNY